MFFLLILFSLFSLFLKQKFIFKTYNQTASYFRNKMNHLSQKLSVNLKQIIFYNSKF